MSAFFTMSGADVMIRLRADSHGAVGDAFFDVHRGEEFCGISYADLIKAASGEIVFDDDGNGRIKTQSHADAEAKVTKASVHYRPGTPDNRCGLCTMFVLNHACTHVEGVINAGNTCDDFENMR